MAVRAVEATALARSHSEALTSRTARGRIPEIVRGLAGRTSPCGSEQHARDARMLLPGVILQPHAIACTALTWCNSARSPCASGRVESIGSACRAGHMAAPVTTTASSNVRSSSSALARFVEWGSAAFSPRWLGMRAEARAFSTEKCKDATCAKSPACGCAGRGTLPRSAGFGHTSTLGARRFSAVVRCTVTPATAATQSAARTKHTAA